MARDSCRIAGSSTSSLVALRKEEPEVFEDPTHSRSSAGGERKLAGVRVDHVDGVRDPIGYLARLRERAPEAWIVVEKITRADERCRRGHADGTTGYEFIERIGALLVEPHGAAMTRRSRIHRQGVGSAARSRARASR